MLILLWPLLTGLALGFVLGLTVGLRLALKRSPRRKVVALAAPSRLVKVSQAAEILGVHPNTVRRWQKQGVLKAVRVGLRRDRRFVRSEVEELMKERR